MLWRDSAILAVASLRREDMIQRLLRGISDAFTEFITDRVLYALMILAILL